MTSAKVIIREQDRSSIVPSFEGIYGAITIVSKKGPVNEPILITSTNQLLDVFGTPDPKLGVSMYSAINYLSQGNKLWISRSFHDDIKYSASLVRSNIVEIPQGYNDVFTDESRIVNPIVGGLFIDEVDNYNFPVYSTNKIYELLDNSIIKESDGKLVVVNNFNGINVNDRLTFSSSSLIALNSNTDSVGESAATYSVVDKIQSVDNLEVLTLGSTVVASIDDTVILKDTTTHAQITGVKVIRSTGAGGSNQLYVNDSDSIPVNVIIQIGSTPIEATVSDKSIVQENVYTLELDGSPSTISVSTPIYRVTQEEIFHRDAFLVTALYPGSWGNEISIGITENTNYEDAFNLIVYYKGNQVESWEVTRGEQLDGFSRQLEMESKINNGSQYIKVVNNVSNVNKDDTYPLPLVTDYALWRQDDEDIFVASTSILSESLLQGHDQVTTGSIVDPKFVVNARLKFEIAENVLSKEYKIKAISSRVITLDREIEELNISHSIIQSGGSSRSTKIYIFDNTNNDSSLGISNGVRKYPITKLSGTTYKTYSLNSRLSIGSLEGVLLAGGFELLLGGDLGSVVTVGDILKGLDIFRNRESTPFNLLMDGGFSYPSIALAINEIVSQNNLAHGYLSSSFTSEESANPTQTVVEYKNSCNVNSSKCSMFTGWIRVYDKYNQLYVWISPEGFAAASQVFTTRNFNVATPAAGWNTGKISGLDVRVKYDEGQRDYLVANRINPIRRKEGSGLVIWGNETLLTKPSPLQLRSVAMLLIVIKTGLEGLLEYKTFELNNEDTWAIVEGSINAFMRDEIQAKGGVYAYEVAVQSIITPSDLDARRLPIFLGIQPTSDIKTIETTLSIFNNTIDITV